ncbi:hypothetical protein CRG98_004554 [Punica granatum]|uniref:Uncharacterized protein n=1 Tax=Punica granatum TaxID=22663 RepID=A0A2I0L379_PUNGR|nr:hypothetical protein CRG98_004554 [Punica granatum]
MDQNGMLTAVVSSQQSGSRHRSGRSGGHRRRRSSSLSSTAATSHGSEAKDRDSDSEAEGSIRSYRLRHRMEKLRRRMSWRRFEKGLLVRFGSSEHEDANEATNKLRQKGAFREYLGEFELLMNTLPHWHPSALLGAFMTGLKEEIAGELRMWRPKDLQTAIELTKRRDEQLQRARRAGDGLARSGFKIATGGTGAQAVQPPPRANLGPTCSGIKAMLIEVVEEDEGKAVEKPLKEETEHISIHALTGQRCKPEFHRPTGGRAIKVSRDRAAAFTVWVANDERLVVLGMPWLEQLGLTLTDYKEMMMEFGTEGVVQASWHNAENELRLSPQTDDQTEVINQCLKQYLHCFVYYQPWLWERYLVWAEYWYNTTYQRSISMTPFEAVYGRSAPILVGYEPGSMVVDEVEEQLRARDAILRELKSNLAAAQNRMKAAADKHRWDEEFEVGDWMYLKLQPYRQHSVFKRANQKLTSRYFGPFQVIARVEAAAYRLDLPDYAKIHPVFHVTLLRRRVGERQAVQPTLPPYASDGLPDLAPVDVRDYRWVAHSGGRTREALVLWNALPDEEATWEPVKVLKQHFPTLNLEDKVRPEGGGVDGTSSASDVRRSQRRARPNPRYAN